MVLKMGDSSSEDAKTKKRRRVTKSEDSSFINFNKQQGDVTIPQTLVPCSSSLTTKKICFWGKEEEDLVGNISWYVINISIKPKQLTKEIKKLAAFNHQLLHSHIEKNTSTLTPVLSFPMKNSPFPFIYNTFATLDSFLYSIGGLYDYPEEDGKRLKKSSKKSGSNLVYYFDTSCNHISYCWKQAPSMISHRQKPQVATVSGKLYVFGCFGKEKCPHEPCCVWAEFFDPSTGEWDSLPVPEFKDCLVVFSPNHLKMNKISKKILVLADNHLFHKFDTENNCWSLIAKVDHNINSFTGYKPPVVVGNVLYWFDNNAKAYDILKDEAFEGPVQDFSFQRAMRMKSKEYNSIDDKPATIHLGGRYFCLLAYLPDFEENNPGHIHCLIIKVSKTSQCYERFCGVERKDIMKFFLGAHVVSCQSFPIDHKMEYNSIDDKPETIHLGGRYFCLLAYLPDLEENNPGHIHCLIIKVSKTNQCYERFCGEERKDIMKFFLGAHVVSCQSFPIDRKMEFIDGRILMI